LPVRRDFIVTLRFALFALPLLALVPQFARYRAFTPASPEISYPETRQDAIVEEHFGQQVTDPYRWLENDIRTDAAVTGWVEDQNTVTGAYLSTLPGRDHIQDRLTALLDYERLTPPERRANRYFYRRNAGLENQASLYVRDGVHGTERMLIDPNTWSTDGATAMAEWSASPDGSYVAYAVQDGGSDWRTIKVIDVVSGQVLDDQVEWARYTEISWARDGSGFFYARYPEPRQEPVLLAGVANHALYFHALGTPQEQDALLFATPEQPNLLHTLKISDDGRYAVIASTPGASINNLTVVDLATADWQPRTLIGNLDDEWDFVGNAGTTLYFVTTKDAERRRIVTMDLAETEPSITTLVGEDADVLNQAWLIGGRLLVAYLHDAMTEVRRYTLAGAPDGTVPLPGIGTAGGFQGEAGHNEAFFVFTSYNAPTTIYQYDVAANQRTVWAEAAVPVDLDQIEVEQQFATSSDGTRVPLFVVRRKDVTGPAPTLLYAYGGFGISLSPVFSPPWLTWIEQGGVVAVANLRGGGEYGRAWHYAGRREQKQNVFDDFIAASEFLITTGITPPDGLAIQGDSNGGLLVGAVVNQRPELFAAALPGVGVMDMLRFNQFTSGQLWMDEFGDPGDEAAFQNLLRYSPYHNIASGRTYPAILATTADTDDRVVPGHTFKYIAALQAADIGPKPHLVRIETRAGHGAGKPLDKVIAEIADLWAFAAHWTGLRVAPRD
jgi:prolyl oligopeptidase